MSEPVKIVIVLEGGMVSDVITAGIPVEFVTIDYDTDGAEPGSLVAVPQSPPHGIEVGYVSEPASATREEFWCAWALQAHDHKFGYTKPYSTEALKLFDSGDLTKDETLEVLQEVGWTERRAHQIIEDHERGV